MSIEMIKLEIHRGEALNYVLLQILVAHYATVGSSYHRKINACILRCLLN